MGAFGFDMDINDMKNIMPSKLHLVSKFNFITFFVLNFKFFNVFSYVSPIHYRYLVGNLWQTSTPSPKACSSDP